MARRRHLLDALRLPDFRRLLGSRLAAQFGDGVFQASLAGAVLFNPERAARPAQVAAGFAVLLLPYSLLGPFAGVLLDRWWRRNVLVTVNAFRAAGVLVVAAEIAAGWTGPAFYVTTLVLVSAGRFVLSALSASLPRVVSSAELVTANALSTTSGGLAGATGGALAIGARWLAGDSNAGYAVVAAAALVPYAVAAAIAGRFAHADLGPSDAERRCRETAAEVVRGLRAGVRHVVGLPSVRAALAAITIHRLCYGVTTVCTLLLYRNYFVDDGFWRAGLGGLAQVVVAIAAGGALAAAVTPVAFRHVGRTAWPAALLVAGAAATVLLFLPYRLPLLTVGACVLGFVAQGVKISVDTVLQQDVDDRFRGRVFTIYDMLFNVAVVAAAALTATVLPADGHSPVSVLVIAAGYAVTAAAYVSSAPRPIPAVR